MTIVFYSNFLTHHQLPFCLEMRKRLGDAFWLVATEPLAEEQQKLGYPDLNNEYPFVIRAYESSEQKKKAIELANTADVVILGSAPISLVQQRLKEKKLTFCYSERIYKKGYEAWKLPVRLFRFFRKYGRHKSLYLLCASAYTAGDFAKTLTFINKAYKWGYFPEVKCYENMDALISKKDPASILWAGRFIDWKHPESVIAVAQRLKADGFDFRIHMIGNGELLETIGELVKANDLEEHVCLTGSMPPEEVRTYMERAAIYLFTSDRNEGWGAVLNESMNSGCAVVASDAIGSVPFLIENNKNGMIYESGNVEDLYQKVKSLLDSPETCKEMGTKAYETMTGLWNAEAAVPRLLSLCEALLSGEKRPVLFHEGPCSKAEILKDK